MASHRTHVLHAQALPRAMRQIRRHAWQQGPRDNAMVAQLAGSFAAFKETLKHVRIVDVPLPIAPADCHECGRTKSHKLDCSEGRTA